MDARYISAYFHLAAYSRLNWFTGMCVVDKRSRKKREDVEEGEKPGDSGNWLSARAGNRLRRCIASPGKDLFGPFLLQRIFAQR